MASAKSKKKYVSLGMPQNLFEEVEKLAEEVGVTRNSLLLIAIKSYVDQNKAVKSMDGMKDFMKEKLENAFKQAISED